MLKKYVTYGFIGVIASVIGAYIVFPNLKTIRRKINNGFNIS